jgi:hypothetical protein
MLSSGRVVFHLRPAREVWKRCQQLAPRNHHDAIVLGIGTRTDRRQVLSNDYQDFPSRVRAEAKKHLKVAVLDSHEYAAAEGSSER